MKPIPAPLAIVLTGLITIAMIPVIALALAVVALVSAWDAITE